LPRFAPLSYSTQRSVSDVLDLAEEGAEVIVRWGDFGRPIKDVHATVARHPYLDLEPNQTYDLSRVPRG
jgi:hypothetical protein